MWLRWSHDPSRLSIQPWRQAEYSSEPQAHWSAVLLISSHTTSLWNHQPQIGFRQWRPGEDRHAASRRRLTLASLCLIAVGPWPSPTPRFPRRPDHLDYYRQANEFTFRRKSPHSSQASEANQLFVKLLHKAVQQGNRSRYNGIVGSHSRPSGNQHLGDYKSEVGYPSLSNSFLLGVT